jgi:hypothetical protein
MSQKKTAQRRFGLLILLSLLLHVVLYKGVDWASLFKPEPLPELKPDEPEQVTLKFNLAQRSEPEPELKPETQPAPESAQPEPEEPVPVSNAQESASNNQQDRNAGQIVFGADKPASEPVSKVGDVKKKNDVTETPMQTPDTRLRSDTDQVAPESGTPITGERAQEAREGGRSSRTLTTDSERAMWSVPQKEETAPRQAQRRRPDAGEPDASGDEDRSTEPTPAEAKQALHKRVEEDLKALFGENFSRETHNIDTLPEVDVADLETPGEGEQAEGNLNMLTDPQLREVGVEQPFSEKESEELRVVNLILERMNRQVIEHWVNPYKGGKMYRGVIKVELDADGYLRDAFVYHQSGLVLLDISVLDAIRAVKRFDVPDNKVIAERYYSNLSFHYSSLDEKPEMMPFELDGKKKDKAKSSKQNADASAANSKNADPNDTDNKETP